MKKFPILVILVSFICAGCATAIKYGYNGDLHRGVSKLKLALVVNTVQDLRTPDEHDGTFSTTKNYFYTRDKLIKKNIGKQVTQTIVRHVQKAKIVESVEAREIGAFQMDDDVLGQLAAEGLDILITADLFHFYGYQSGKASSRTAAAFGLAGVMIEAMANKKIVGGRATLGDVKIIDLRSRQLLWSGDLDFDFERKETFYDGAQAYAIEALKMVNDQLVRKIDEVLRGGASVEITKE